MICRSDAGSTIEAGLGLPRAGSGHDFRCPEKEKPGGGNAGSDLFVIGVYGFKYAA
jgi:hypothetical protein